MPRIIAPVAPSGWPIAIAPPLTLTLSCGDAEVLHEPHHHRRERLVHLEQVDVVDRQPGLASALRAAGAGPVSMMVGSAPQTRGRDDPSARRQAVALADLLAADGTSGGAVDDARGVAGVVDVVDPLDPVVLLERDRVEAALLADAGEARLERGEASRRSCSGRMNSSWSRMVRPLRSLHRDDRAGEVAVGPRLGGARLRLRGVRVDVGAAPALERRDQVGADALRHEVGGERGRRVHAHAPPSEPIGTRLIDSTPPARIRSSQPRADPLRGLVDGLETTRRRSG